MSEFKNFGLAGVGSNVQLGKSGPNLVSNAGAIEAHQMILSLWHSLVP